MEEQGIFIERILSNENMNRAYKQVKKNKGAAGIDGMECADLLSHLKVNGQQLRESIRNQSYKPMPVKRMAGTRLPLKWPGSQQAPAVGTYLRLGLRV